MSPLNAEDIRVYERLAALETKMDFMIEGLSEQKAYLRRYIDRQENRKPGRIYAAGAAGLATIISALIAVIGRLL